MTEPGREPFQSVVTLVPEAERVVADYRARGDRWTQQGVPAHITIAGPWPLAVAIPSKDLSRVAEAFSGKRYRLDRLGMVGDTLCLLLSDEAPLLAVRERVIELVGAADAVDAAWRFHLTIARFPQDDLAEEVRREVSPLLPLLCTLRGLRLARLLEDARVTVTQL